MAKFSLNAARVAEGGEGRWKRAERVGWKMGGKWCLEERVSFMELTTIW